MSDSNLPPKFPEPVEPPPIGPDYSGPDPRIYNCVRISGFFSMLSAVFWFVTFPPVAIVPAITFAAELYYMGRCDGMDRKRAHSLALKVSFLELATGLVTFCSPPSLICAFLNRRYALAA